jgi:hypothetical protein
MLNTITPTVFYRTLNMEGLELFYRGLQQRQDVLTLPLRTVLPIVVPPTQWRIGNARVPVGRRAVVSRRDEQIPRPGCLSNEQGEMKQYQEEHSLDAAQGHPPSGYRPVDHLITGPFQSNVVIGVDSKGSRLLAGDSVRGQGCLVRPYTRVVARALQPHEQLTSQ